MSSALAKDRPLTVNQLFKKQLKGKFGAVEGGAPLSISNASLIRWAKL